MCLFRIGADLNFEASSVNDGGWGGGVGDCRNSGCWKATVAITGRFPLQISRAAEHSESFLFVPPATMPLMF